MRKLIVTLALGMILWHWETGSAQTKNSTLIILNIPSDFWHFNKVNNLCFRGRPKAECGSFLLTEFGFLIRVDKLPVKTEADWGHFDFTWDLGWMMNVSGSSAV